MASCVLGIDIGTSTVKVILVEKESGCVVQESAHSLGSKHVEVPDIPGARERGVGHIWLSLDEAMKGLDASRMHSVCSIGVCGQMHGCVLWNDSIGCDPSRPLQAHSSSNLITWQDSRCSQEFLSSLPSPPSRQSVSSSVSTGYGCATLAWLQKHRPTQAISPYSRAGTVMDFVVWRLCLMKEKTPQPVLMSSQNATSWGYFNMKTMQWEKDLLKDTDFPLHLLPEVVVAPALAGALGASWHGVPRGTPVGVAMGDLQCSFIATDPSPSDAVLNVGSASQLGVIRPARSAAADPPGPSHVHIHMDIPASVMEVPYFNGDSLIVAASLSGANTLSTLVDTLRGWMAELGVDLGGESVPSDSALYERLVCLAAGKLDTPLDVRVTLWGERYDTALAGAVANITPGHLSMGDISSAMFRGVVGNLQAMMPKQLFRSLKITRLLGSGSALQRNPILQHHAKGVFNLPLEMRAQADAPLGAALAVRGLSCHGDSQKCGHETL